MTVLKLSKKLQKFMGIYSEDASGLGGKLYMGVMNVVMVSGMCVLVVGSFLYICMNLLDMATSTNAMIVMMAGSSGVGCYCGIASNLKSTRKLYTLLQQIVDKSLKYRGFTDFSEAEEKSHFLSKWFTMFMMLFFTLGTILVTLAMALWNMYKGNYDTSNWFLPYRIILPFDRSSMFAWYCEFFLQAYSGYAFVLTITSTVTFFGGCSYYIDACLRQFKHMFNEIDENVKNGESGEMIEKKVFETVVFHNNILDVFDTVADIFNAAIFFHLICNIIFFAGAIYQTEMTIGKVGLDLLFNVLCVMEGLSYTFILCFFADSATYSMAELANAVYYSSWYTQPPKIQKLLLLIIARAQRPNLFMGFKIIYCHLESFTKLNKTAATYYIMFRNIQTR